jgi:hypothetical protein
VQSRRWLTWEKVSHNKRQLTWSRGLREWAGLHVEHTDEEIAAQDMYGEDQLVIPAESWPAVRAELADLLDTAEDGGVAAARLWLDRRQLAWSVAINGQPPNRPGGVARPPCTTGSGWPVMAWVWAGRGQPPGWRAPSGMYERPRRAAARRVVRAAR